MSHSATVLSVAGAYLAISLVLGMWPARKSTATATGFVAGDRQVGLLLMYFIMGASIFSAFAFLGLPGWAQSRGAAGFYILAYGVLGFLPFYFLGPRAARIGRALGVVTQAELVAKRFDSRALAGAMAAISVLSFVPYLALQIEGAGYVLNAMSGGEVSPELGGAIVYGVVLTYVLRSGVLGVGWTNTFQGIFMMVLAWVLGLSLPNLLHGGVGEMFDRIATERPELLEIPGLSPEVRPDGSRSLWSVSEYSTAILVSAIGFTFWPHLFMKAFSARDERTIRRTVVLYPTFQIFLVPLYLIGFAGVFFEPLPERADQILPHMLMNLELSPMVVGLFCAGALAASMSSGDAMAHAAGSIAVRDGWYAARGRRDTAGAERRLIRWAIVAIMLVSYLFAVVYEGSLVALLLAAYGGVVQFAPAVTASLYWKRARGDYTIAMDSPGVLDLMCLAAKHNVVLIVHMETTVAATSAVIMPAIKAISVAPGKKANISAKPSM